MSAPSIEFLDLLTRFAEATKGTPSEAVAAKWLEVYLIPWQRPERDVMPKAPPTQSRSL